MDSSGFCSPRSDCFPAGLRVLVVDDDPTWLKILEKMLKKCNYEVRTCNLAREALDLLRERKDGFDIVISDVNMPDMDGFKLLEHVGLEMDLPVIMMSVDGETSRVMKGVQHGACDYLLKPIRMKELRNIWQHVFRKRIHEVRDIEGQESLEEIYMMRNGLEQSDQDGYFFSGDNIMSSGKKRKDCDISSKHDDRVCGNDPSSSAKRTRVVWTVDLHQRFVKAVNQIGIDKVGPKKILDLMGVPWLTRENVASHLQKYRLYLGRLQKENELKSAFSGIKHSDVSAKDSPTNVCLPNSISKITCLQKIATKNNHAPPAPITLIHKDGSKTCEGKIKGNLSTSIKESLKTPLGDMINPEKCSASRIGFGSSFTPGDVEVKPEPKILAHYSWGAEAPSIQFKQEAKLNLQSKNQLNCLPPMHQNQGDPVQPNICHNSTPSSKEADKPSIAYVKPSYANRFGKITEVKSTSDLFSVNLESHLPDFHAFEQTQSSIWSKKNRDLEHNIFDDPGLHQRNPSLTSFSLWDKEFNNFSSQGDFYLPNSGFGITETFGNEEIITDIPPYLYGLVDSHCEFPVEPMEYPVMDQGLYIL